MTPLILSLAAFVGTHFIMSHPLRAAMVKSLGEKGFALAYSLVSLSTFAWVIFAFRAAPQTLPLWDDSDAIWWAATVLMLLGSILFAGSLVGNPALPQPGADRLATAEPRGVFAITRHPMMWGFALWSATHILASPQARVLWLAGAMAFLALAGAMGQDWKKAVLMGDAWSGWVSRTSFTPFLNQLQGRAGWRAAWPGRTVLLAGTVLWLVASWAHPWLGGPIAGLWRWL